MALYQFQFLSNTIHFETKIFQFKPLVPSLSKIKSSSIPHTIKCKASKTIVSHQNNTSSRSANHFQPSIWDYDYIQSIRSDFVEESYLKKFDRLKEEVRLMLLTLANPVEQLELIDDMQRLGVDSHFSQEIRNIMEKIYNNDTLKINNNLHAMALEFRLLRQQGYDVSSEKFDEFLDNKGNFHSYLSGDIKGMLALYEASFHSMEGEIEMDKAREFCLTHLKEFVNKSSEDNQISILVSHALELPLHWRVSRLETRWFIDVYKRRQNMRPILLELAKLGFNIVQATHQEDMKHVSRWWKRTAIGEKLSFTRDRMVENFIWTVGLAIEPQLGNFRRVLSKVNALITTMDDIYDVHGTLEELKLFTEVINIWDINAMHELPDYMKICFLALDTFVNEVAFDFLKEENGHNIIPHLRKVWIDLCKSYLVEATWYHNDHKPNFHEYLENAWISISGPVILFHAYCLHPTSTMKEDSALLEEHSKVIRWSSTILRLANDLGTAKREKVTGDVPKSVECYMNESGASEADAQRHINSLICETWKKLNKEVSHSSYNSGSFIQVAVDLARMALCMYKHGDGHSIQDDETKNLITSLLFQPIE